MTVEKKPGSEMEKNQSRMEKWFPPRQIFFRTHTEIKYFTLSPLLQKTIAASAALGLLWVGYASFNTVFRDQILEAKDNEIAALEAESAQKTRDLETLHGTILEKTETLEDRQGYLKSIIEADPTGSLPKTEDSGDETEPVRESKAGIPPSFLFGRANAATDPAMETKVFLRHMDDRLALIETEQDQMAEHLSAFAERRLTLITDMLAPFKLTAFDLAEATPYAFQFMGQGGPFIPEEAVHFDFSGDEAFSRLQENWTILLRAYSGFRNIPLYEPVKDFYLSSRFGRRTDPFTKQPAWHPGIDLAGWPGTPIYATTAGVVTKAGAWSTYGQMVEVDHGNGFKTRYAHLRKVVAKRGQTVKPGDTLGEMGCTGRCISTHLHYEVYFNGNLRNPQPFMEAPEDVQQTKERAIHPDPELQSGTGD